MKQVCGLTLAVLTIFLLVAPGTASAATERARITWNQANDLDLHVYDDAGNHTFYSDPTAIPDAELSEDVTNAGGPETFTDQRVPSSRSFGYRVCYYGGDSTGAGQTEVTLRLINEAGRRPRQTFTLGRPGNCRRAGTLSLIPGDVDSDADGVDDEVDNCPTDGERDPGGQPTTTVSAMPVTPRPTVTATASSTAPTTARAWPTRARRTPTATASATPARSPTTTGRRLRRRGQLPAVANPGQERRRRRRDRRRLRSTRLPRHLRLRPAPPPPPPPPPRARRARPVGGGRQGRRRHGPHPPPQREVPHARGERVDPARQRGRRDQGACAADVRGGGRRRHPDGRLLPGRVRRHADEGQEADHATSSSRQARLRQEGQGQTSAKGKKVRRLWGDGKGRFRTRGRRAAATVRGTKWLTEDRCDRTKITVRRGRVAVRDLVKRGRRSSRRASRTWPGRRRSSPVHEREQRAQQRRRAEVADLHAHAARRRRPG